MSIARRILSEPNGSRQLDAPAAARAFCVVVGASLMLNGILGLSFGGHEFAVRDDLPHSEFNFFFEFNGWHHVLHVVTAGILLVASLRREWAATGALVFGAVYLVLTPLALIDGDDVANLIYSDPRDNVVHATLAVVGTALGLIALRRPTRRTRINGSSRPPLPSVERK
jgi:hypothetical protein